MIAAGERFKFKDIGGPTSSGLEIDHIDDAKRRHLAIHQRTYALAVLRRYGMSIATVVLHL